MKKLFACLLLSVLMGCSKGANTRKHFIVPSEITVVETAEGKDRREIRAHAKELFVAKNYASLEQLANQYSNVKECYPDGMSRWAQILDGIKPGEEAPETEWKSHLVLLHEWVQSRPNSITARLALGDALIYYAWKARGSGYADTVTEDGWKVLNDRLIQAVKVLKEAGSLSEQCPRRWSLLMSAALGLGATKPQYQALFQNAISAEPGYTGYYFSMAYYLLPRWHGKPGEMEEFVKKSADEVGGDDGDLLYARLTYQLQKVSDNIFNESKLSWERADKGFEVMEKRFPGSLYVQNARAYIALVGCNRSHFPRILIGGLKGQIDAQVWKTKENFLRMTQHL